MTWTRADKESVPLFSDVLSAGPTRTCKGRMELDLWHNTTSYMNGLIHAGIGDRRE